MFVNENISKKKEEKKNESHYEREKLNNVR
jgi:hypothetical protein